MLVELENYVSTNILLLNIEFLWFKEEEVWDISKLELWVPAMMLNEHCQLMVFIA